MCSTYFNIGGELMANITTTTLQVPAKLTKAQRKLGKIMRGDS